jgi:hypothetical protein
MIKRIKSFMITFLFLVTACSVSSGKFVNIELPDKATVDDANEVVYTLIHGDLEKNIMNRFSGWNPEKHLIFIKENNVNFDSSNPENKGLYLTVGTKYTDDLKNIDEILEYAKSLVKKEIDSYFKEKGKST